MQAFCLSMDFCVKRYWTCSKFLSLVSGKYNQFEGSKFVFFWQHKSLLNVRGTDKVIRTAKQKKTPYSVIRFFKGKKSFNVTMIKTQVKALLIDFPLALKRINYITIIFLFYFQFIAWLKIIKDLSETKMIIDTNRMSPG